MQLAKEVEKGCGDCTSMEDEIYWRHIKRISFCLAFHPDFQHKLQIPKKFADNVRQDMLHPKMTLRGPSGASWEMNLIRSVDGLFLQDGWEEFVNAYSLQENDILFFKYDRVSTFSVKIFDGECEKVAAYFVKKCGHVYPGVENQKKRDLSDTVEEEGDEVCIATKKSCKIAGTQPVNYMKKGVGLKRCVMTSKKNTSNKRRVRFAINLLRKKAASRSLSDSHAETYLPKQHGQNTSTSSDKELPVKKGSTDKEVPPSPATDFVEVDLPGTRDQNLPQATENNAPGSEKIASSPLAPITTTYVRKKITSPTAEYISNRRPVTDFEKTVALRKAALELTENSFFSAMPISACYKYFFMTIPARFARTHLGPRNQEIILCVEDKKWSTKFCFSTGKIGPGWKQFAVENSLEEADACLFKLIGQDNGEPVMLDVSIFRVVDEVVPPTHVTVL